MSEDTTSQDLALNDVNSTGGISSNIIADAKRALLDFERAQFEEAEEPKQQLPEAEPFP